jgi:FkbM family methyltransferase
MDPSRLLVVAGKIPLLRRVLRSFARGYREDSVTTIRSGIAAGYRWRRHRRYVNGYWLGQYELPIQHAMRHELKAGEVFYDVGANAGFFSLVAARLVGKGGRCIAFDPWPSNYQSIREQFALNSLDNCVAVGQAVGQADGKATFSSPDSATNTAHLGPSAPGEISIEVEVITLDTARKLYGSPSFIKIDIEGAEVEALRGAATMLIEDRPRFLIEVHTPACEAGVKQILESAGYSLSQLDGKVVDPASPLPKHVLARPTAGDAARSAATRGS